MWWTALDCVALAAFGLGWLGWALVRYFDPDR